MLNKIADPHKKSSPTYDLRQRSRCVLPPTTPRFCIVCVLRTLLALVTGYRRRYSSSGDGWTDRLRFHSARPMRWRMVMKRQSVYGARCGRRCCTLVRAGRMQYQARLCFALTVALCRLSSVYYPGLLQCLCRSRLGQRGNCVLLCLL